MTTNDSKIVSRRRLAEAIGERRKPGLTLAMANGLFDLLHVGHLRYLEGARREADLLLVAINSDASARRLKGPDRPITAAPERAELIAGFACVDFVTVFDEASVEPLLREIRPDVHCKGTDYTADSVPEAEVARELGIRIAIVGDPKDHATSEIVRRLGQVLKRRERVRPGALNAFATDPPGRRSPAGCARRTPSGAGP